LGSGARIVKKGPKPPPRQRRKRAKRERIPNEEIPKAIKEAEAGLSAARATKAELFIAFKTRRRDGPRATLFPPRAGDGV
jgi:hypothetical protein